MAKFAPKQGPTDRRTLCELLNDHLANRGWNLAKLAKESGQSKATISRITNFARQEKSYRPSLRTIQAIALALKLSPEKREELFYTAFPEFSVWDDASTKGYSVIKTDRLLHDKGLPLLTNIKD